MDLDQLANLGEFIGGGAVVVTLLYLALQVSQNTKALRATSVQALHDSVAAGLTAIATSEDTTEILRLGQAGAELSPNQAARFSLLMHAVCRRWENAFVQRRLGALDEAAWEPWELIMRSNFSSPAMRVWWEQARSIYSEDFVRLVESFPIDEDGAAAHGSTIFGASDRR